MKNAASLLEAIRGGDAGTVERLLAEDPSLSSVRDVDGVSALLLSLYHGRGDMAEIFTTAGHEPDLHESAALGLADRVAALVAVDRTSTVETSPDGFTALHLAAFFGRTDTARRLLEAGADPDVVAANAMRVRPLHSAAAGNHDRVAMLLLEAGADPNAAQQLGYTPLMTAASRGNEVLIRALIARGADPATVAEDGQTAASLARERGHADVLPLLMP